MCFLLWVSQVAFPALFITFAALWYERLCRVHNVSAGYFTQRQDTAIKGTVVSLFAVSLM